MNRMNKKAKRIPRSLISLLLALALTMSIVPVAFAAQECVYHDPAEHWLTANDRTNELDVNAVVTHETFYCCICEKNTSFTQWRTAEYTRDGASALTRNVKYSDGTMADGTGKGTILDGTPGVDAYYTGYHWTKAMCDTCGTLNSNEGTTDYGFNTNVYSLYDCAADFMEDLDGTERYEYADSTYHTKITTGGEYCCFCYGTRHADSSVLERHTLQTQIIPQISNGRFAVVEHCTLCDYTKTSYVAAKSVVADYYGVADGQPHTITVSDLSESGVRTQIRYGNSAQSCTLTSAPSYTEEGQYTVYYEIVYTYNGVEMTENGVANVWLRDTAPAEDGSCSCGCGNPNCGCQDSDCKGGCCGDKGCNGDHNFKLLDTVSPTCLTLGYSRYLCLDCGAIEKRDYENALGHANQSVLVREATCETEGKLLEICTRCGHVKTTSLPKGEHRYTTYTVRATCVNPGYTVRECEICGERQITGLTNALPHNYVAYTTAPTCEAGGQTVYHCHGCGSSFVGDHTNALGHSWGDGEVIAQPTCTGEGVRQYTCAHCGETRMETIPATGHTPGEGATCLNPGTCTVCGAVLDKASGHNFQAEVTAPTCLNLGYTTYTCANCGESYKSDYTDPLGHDYKPAVTGPTCTEGGFTTYTCARCGDSYVDNYMDALGHNWDAGRVVTDSVCDSEGVMEYRCKRCGHNRMEAVSAKGHTPGEEATCTTAQLCTVCGAVLAEPTGHNFRSEVTAPTCLKMGYTTYTCDTCGFSYQNGYTDPLGHDYKPTVTEPTCTEGGFTTYTCARCGNSYVDDHTDALGHSWGDGDVIAQPTCTGEGVRQYTCTRCGKTRMEAIPATGHTPGEGATCLNPGTCTVCGAVLDKASGHNFRAEVTAPTCLNLGYTTYTCANCGDSYKSDYTDPLGHSWGDGDVIAQPTCTGEGVRQYTCAHCGETRMETIPATGHTPGEEATCTTAHLCTVCGAVLAEPTGHSYTQEVTAPTCTALGYTTYTCDKCGNSYKADFVNAAGHTAGDWIVDKEPTTGAEGSKHRVCVNCGEVLETGTIGKIYHFAYTGNYGEAVVGDYLVTVTDTKSGNAVHSAAVSLHEDGSLSVVLPDGRLIDYAAQTTVTVQLKEDKSPVEGVAIAVTDQNGNYAPGKTGADGKLTVPAASGDTNSEGKITIGGTDKDGKPVTLTVKVEDFESGRPIADANVEMKHGKLHVLLPNGTDMDAGNRILVTVLYHTKAPVRALDVAVQNDLGNQEQGQTNKDGKLIVPALGSTYTDSTGTAIVGKYTVIVSDSGKKPVVKALVTLIEGKKDAFTVLLPDGRLLDANDKTTVTVLLPSGDPAVGLNVKVLDHRDNHAAKDTDKAGQVLVPDATGSTGETIGKDTGKEDEANTIKVSVTDEGGREVPGAEITVDGKGSVTVTLPKGFTFEDDGTVTVTVTDNRDKPIADVSVSVTDGAGENAKGETDRYGKLTVPTKVEVAEHSAYIYGYPDGTFGPSRSMTRAEAAAIFARLLAAKNGDTLYDNVHCSFSDVPKRAWYAGYVKYLETFDVLSGYVDGTFRPDSPIIRAEFVTISVRFYRAYGIRITEEAEKLAFSDVSRRHWAAGYIDEAAVNGWVLGYGDGTFAPDKPITRAEVVTIVNRVLSREADRAYIAANTGSVRTFPDVPGRHWAYYDVLEAANAHRSPIQEGAERWQGKK